MDDHSSARVRVVDAALRCIARVGLAKTTGDDVAREARTSRATLYRHFPGGMPAVVRAVVDTETARLFSELGAVMGDARDLEELLVAGIVGAARRLRSHEALGYLLEHEPGTILPHLTFGGMDKVLSVASSVTAPFLGRWLGPEDAARAAEWATRIVVSYLSCASDSMDLTDDVAARHLVATYMAPGIQALTMDDPARAGRARTSGRTTRRPREGQG